MAKKTRRGSFIVFEGIDGSGTTTQVSGATTWLRDRGELVHPTAEPSTGPIGNMIRQILGGRLQARAPGAGCEPMEPATTALLFAADRLDHIQNEIRPYLEKGYHVICDRYVLSSLAYQGADVDLRFARRINDKAIAPDLTFYLKVRPEVAMARIEASREAREAFENLSFQRKVAQIYDKLFSEYRDGRVVEIDGEVAPGSIAASIRNELETLL